jgi:hypothetical protein
MHLPDNASGMMDSRFRGTTAKLANDRVGERRVEIRGLNRRLANQALRAGCVGNRIVTSSPPPSAFFA